MSPVNPELAVAARRELVRQGLEVPCVGVEADLTAEEAPPRPPAALEAAANLLVPYVVVHTSSSDSAAVREKLAPLVEAAERAGVGAAAGEQRRHGRHPAAGGGAGPLRLRQPGRLLVHVRHLPVRQGKVPQQTITNLGGLRPPRSASVTAPPAAGAPRWAMSSSARGDLPLQA